MSPHAPVPPRQGEASKYYGGKLHAKPVTSYKGGGSVAKPARFESTMPLSHRGRAKASKYYGGKLHAKPVTSYKGQRLRGETRPIRVHTMPLSHRGRKSVQIRRQTPCQASHQL